MNERWASYTRRYEGLSVLPYQCPTGHLTIGYGHNLELGISKEVADVLLQQDMQSAQQAVAKRFAWWAQLNEVRQFVLVDMCFNMGLAKLCTFKKMVAALRRADYTAAASEMLNSRWAVQVGHRAQELAAMMKTGEYI
jgi:lysozyme